MEYYYGQAWVGGKTTRIRVKPEMIENGIVKEIELYLLTRLRSSGTTLFNSVEEYDWHPKRSRHDTPACREIWVEIDGVKQSLKFP